MKLKWIAAVVLLTTMSRATAGPIASNWQYESTLVSGPGGFIWNTPAGGPATSTSFDVNSGWQMPGPPNSPYFPSAELGVVNVVTNGINLPGETFHEAGQGPYELSMTILDPSGATGNLTFTGTLGLVFNGLPPGAQTANNAYGGASFNQQTQSLVIGGNLYTVSMSFGAPLDFPQWDSHWFPTNGQSVWSAPAGEFYASVTQTPAAPEPATLALAGLGIGFVALRRARKMASHRSDC
jgi:hypothetical protein